MPAVSIVWGGAERLSGTGFRGRRCSRDADIAGEHIMVFLENERYSRRRRVLRRWEMEDRTKKHLIDWRIERLRRHRYCYGWVEFSQVVLRLAWFFTLRTGRLKGIRWNPCRFS